MDNLCGFTNAGGETSFDTLALRRCMGRLDERWSAGAPVASA
jgi:hypothetical protein